MSDREVDQLQPCPRGRAGGEEAIQDVDSTCEIRSNLFEDNDSGLIDNPLLQWEPAKAERNAKRFAEAFSLHNQTDILIKAAKILRDPEAWRSVPNLTADEVEALKRESQCGFWRQPKELKVTIMTLCVAAVVQGWNQTASNGANLNWPVQLGLKNLIGCNPQGTEAWIFAVVNASAYLSASLIGCWLSDPLNEYFFGRRAAICISAALNIASIIGCALTQTWRQLLGCRILLGIGMGAKASVVPVFAAEVAPAHIRGSLVMNWQLFDALGIFLGFTANLVVSQVGRAAWRWQTVSSILPAIILLSMIFACPESPRFLMKHGRYLAAYRVLVALRSEPILAAKEILYTHYQMDVEMRLLSQGRHVDAEANRPGEAVKSGSRTEKYIPRLRLGLTRRPKYAVNYWQKLWQLFRIKRMRRAMVATSVVMITQQLCGVNVLSFYSSTFFCDVDSQKGRNATTGESYLQPLFLSWGNGLSNFVFAFPAYWLIDRRGRRWLLLVTLPFMALTMLASGLSFLIPARNAAHAPVIGLFLYVFMFFYSWGVGPVPFTMSAEVFPLENRVVGMSFSVFVNLFGAGLLTLLVPALTNAIGHSGVLGIFAGLNLLAFFLVFFFVRETAGAALGSTPGSMTFMSLEELNYIFGVSTMKYATYQVTKVIPWVWRYYVLQDQRCPDQPEKLYTWAQAREEAHQADEEVVEQG